MKKTSFSLLLAVAVVCYSIISGFDTGPANSQQYNCTGAETDFGNPAGCKNCHGNVASTKIDVTIELDSAGTTTTHYKGGMDYTVKLTGTNNTTNILPNFGFQIGSIVGSTAQQAPTNAGTWNSPYPPNTHYAAPVPSLYLVGLVEHSSPLNASSGTGGNGTTYTLSFNWTAPDSGTGTVSIWAALNTVNGNSNSSGDFWNTNHIVLDEWQPVSTAISSHEKNLLEADIFPNPFSENAMVRITNFNEYTNEELEFTIYDLTGRAVFQSAIRNPQFTIQRNGLPSGIYFYQITADKSREFGSASGKLLIE